MVASIGAYDYQKYPVTFGTCQIWLFADAMEHGCYGYRFISEYRNTYVNISALHAMVSEH